MIRLQRQDAGFRTGHLFTAHIFVPPARYNDPAAIARFCDQCANASARSPVS
jgi:hypothetical protein